MIPWLQYKSFDTEDYKTIKNIWGLEGLLNFIPSFKDELWVDVAIYNGLSAYRKNAEPLAYLELEEKHNWKGEFSLLRCSVLAKSISLPS